MRERQWREEARVIEARCPGWAVIYGWYTRMFWAFGAPDGRPITARSASELLGRIRAAERSQVGLHYQEGSPYRAWRRRISDDR
jgi:hypothetical protein